MNGPTVYFTIGPQGAGKSTYCRKVLENVPQAIHIERDAMSLARFGTINPVYPDGDQWLVVETLRRVSEAIADNSQAKILIDYSVADDQNRAEFARLFKTRGVTRVIGWHFITPMDVAVRRFIQRGINEDPIMARQALTGMFGSVIREIMETSSRDHYQRFARPAKYIPHFDHIIDIDPDNPPQLKEALML